MPKHDDQIIDPNGQEGESGERKAPSLPPSGQKGRLALMLADRSPNQDFLGFVVGPSLFPHASGEKAHHSRTPLHLVQDEQSAMVNERARACTFLILSQNQARKGSWPCPTGGVMCMCVSPLRETHKKNVGKWGGRGEARGGVG